MTISDLLTELDRQIARAERAMLDQTHGAAVCQIHKDGRVTGGLKYAEGQLVALRSARRQLVAADADPHAIIMAERANWQTQLTRHQAAERPSVPWLAYSQGGLDALAQLPTDIATA